MIEDLCAGKIDLTIKLFPVLSWLVKDRPELALIMEVPTHEKIAVAASATARLVAQHPIAQDADALDLELNDVTRFEEAHLLEAAAVADRA